MANSWTRLLTVRSVYYDMVRPRTNEIKTIDVVFRSQTYNEKNNTKTVCKRQNIIKAVYTRDNDRETTKTILYCRSMIIIQTLDNYSLKSTRIEITRWEKSLGRGTNWISYGGEVHRDAEKRKRSVADEKHCSNNSSYLIELWKLLYLHWVLEYTKY